MNEPRQLDWLADASFARVVTRASKPLARRGDVETSREAAAKATSIAGDHERRILAAITKAGPHGACSKEIARATVLTHVQVDRRLSTLGERELIERKYEGGRLVRREGCAVWVTA